MRIMNRTSILLLRLLHILIVNSFFISHSLSQQCAESENFYKEYFQKNYDSLDPIEGIWSVNSTSKVFDVYGQLKDSWYAPQSNKVRIVRENDKLILCSLLEGQTENDIIFFKNTATPGIYLYERNYAGSNLVAKANALIANPGMIEYSYEIPQAQLKYKMGKKYIKGASMFVEIKMIKISPALKENKITGISSGTGFALTSDGFIVTNHHVVEEASSISVKGINGDFTISYKANVLFEDKNNDLAILKIVDGDFMDLGIVPYTIANKSSDVGTSVFCLGFPLRATMGDEVKLTNGIISSKSGFQGDITTYQISAPVQPGNSGGPLFNDFGELIGVINAKHTSAENVSYAVKSSYLLNLIDMVPTFSRMSTTNKLTGKSLAEQVKLISGFTYIIEAQ